MKEQANNVFASIQQFWKSQTKKQHITYISILGGIIVIAIILSMVMGKTNYVVLFSNLDDTEASQIITEIQSMGIDATVKADGTIVVPKEQENSLRMQLGVKGYPKSSFSYNIWNENVNMFTTDSQKREILKQQLQERLQATIKELDGVNFARVTLDIPETSNTVISTNTKKASASVTVHLDPGVTLSSGQVKGISHIVMMSISGLTEENISIIDGNANLLSSGAEGDNSSGLDAERLKFKNQFETTISSKIMELLTPSYGDDGIKVSVNALFNYDKKITEDTKYTPSVDENGMVSHEDETSSSSNDGTGGEVVGVEPNADGTYPTKETTTTGAGWTETSKSTDYLVNTLKEQTEKNGNYVEKVSVSVTVYSNNLADEEKTKIANVATFTAGTLPELVTVNNFIKAADKPLDPLVPNEDDKYFGLSLNELLIIAGVALIFIIIFIIVFTTALRKSKSKKKNVNRKLSYANMSRLDDDQPPVDIRKLTDKPVETKEAAIRREIGEFTKTSPEIAAQLLKSWLREGGER